MPSLSFTIDELQPIISATVAAALEQIRAADAQLPTDRLAWSEPEAAALLGL